MLLSVTDGCETLLDHTPSVKIHRDRGGAALGLPRILDSVLYMNSVVRIFSGLSGQVSLAINRSFFSEFNDRNNAPVRPFHNLQTCYTNIL
jgi:hypothetical protein